MCSDATGRDVKTEVVIVTRDVFTIAEAKKFAQRILDVARRATRELRLMKRREREGHRDVRRYRASSRAALIRSAR